MYLGGKIVKNPYGMTPQERAFEKMVSNLTVLIEGNFRPTYKVVFSEKWISYLTLKASLINCGGIKP